jgi:hypothetical protein
MKHVVASLTIGACLLLPSAGVVFADNPHGVNGVTTGRPGTQPPGAPGTGASCGSLSVDGAPPGSSGGPPGQLVAPGVTPTSNSPFALDIMGINKPYAGLAGKSGAAGGAPASQYDVACFQHQMK